MNLNFINIATYSLYFCIFQKNQSHYRTNLNQVPTLYNKCSRSVTKFLPMNKKFAFQNIGPYFFKKVI